VSDEAPLKSHERWSLIAGLLILSLAGAVGILISTRDCAGTSTDSRSYLMAARSLREGRGLYVLSINGLPVPQTHHAPLYSVLLAAASFVTRTPVEEAARWLNALGFAGSIALVGLFVRTVAGAGAGWIALVSAAAFALSPDMLQVHSMIWSEASFIFFMLLTLLMLARANRRDEWNDVVLAGCAAALAWATRYAGAALVAAGAIMLLLDASHTPRRRWRRAAAFTLIGSSLALAWAVRNALLAETIANRSFGFHPPSLNAWLGGLITISGWFGSGWKGRSSRTGVFVLAAVLGVALLARRWLRRTAPTERNADLPAVFALLYALLLVASVTFLDRTIPLDRRILSPLFVAALLFAGGWIGAWTAHRPQPRPLVALASATCVGLILLAGRGVQFVDDAPDKWLVYGCRRWSNSELLTYARQLPPDAVLYSNADDVLYLRLGRLAKPVPSVERDQRYLDAAVRRLKADLRAGAQVVYFNTVTRAHRMREQDLRRLTGASVVHAKYDGVVLASPRRLASTQPAGAAPNTARATTQHKRRARG
jgi:hypothetical protein